MKIGPIEITEADVRAATNVCRESIRRLAVPKNKKNKIGIVVALVTESPEEKQRLEHDFLDELRQFLARSDLSALFKIIEFPDQLSKRIVDKDHARTYLIRARAHFIVYGQLVQRQFQGRPSHLFKLRGLVRHAPVVRTVSDTLAREFSLLLPGKITFEENSEVLGFELTAQWVGCVVRYIIAMAAFISGDLDLAYRLFKELETQTHNRTHSGTPVVEEIARRLPKRIETVLELLLQRSYFRYARTRNRSCLRDAKPLIDELKSLNSASYQARLLNAIVLYYQGDIESAISELQGVGSRDPTWRFSLGFLLAFKGDINGALEQYQKAFYGETSSNVINDLDVFISEVIEEHAEMTQLLFFRGLINFKGKPDYELARQDFDQFLRYSGDDSHARLVELANKYLGQIREHLGTSA